MTEKLFYKDAYMREFDAVVTDVCRDGNAMTVCLDRTAFYPEGGGQPADHGMLITGDGRRLTVTDVHEKNGMILHTVLTQAGDDTEPVPGMKLHGIIDWERRFDHMQQHSGEHIVSGMICDRFGCSNVGFHMGETLITIDYDAVISMEEALLIEKQANAYIWENHEISISWPDPDELKRLPYRSKKELEGAVRIVAFPGADMCACCGTHVERSGEVGLVRLVSAQKFHDGTRLELYCGKRAFDFLSMNHRENKLIGVMLHTKESGTAAVVENKLNENAELRIRLARTEEELFEYIAVQYRDRGDSLIFKEGLSPDSVRKLAVTLGKSCRGLAAVFSADEKGYKYALSCEGGEIGELVKSMNRTLNGRGGGRGGFAQGSAVCSREEIEKFFAGER